MPSDELTYLKTKQLEGNSSEIVAVVFEPTDGNMSRQRDNRNRKFSVLAGNVKEYIQVWSK